MMSYISRCWGIYLADLFLVGPRPFFHCIWSYQTPSGYIFRVRSPIRVFLMSGGVLIHPFTRMNVATFPHVWFRTTVLNLPFAIKGYRSVLSLALHCSRVRLLLVLGNRAFNWCSCIKLASATMSGSIWISTLCNLTIVWFCYRVIFFVWNLSVNAWIKYSSSELADESSSLVFFILRVCLFRLVSCFSDSSICMAALSSAYRWEMVFFITLSASFPIGWDVGLFSMVVFAILTLSLYWHCRCIDIVAVLTLLLYWHCRCINIVAVLTFSLFTLPLLVRWHLSFYSIYLFCSCLGGSNINHPWYTPFELLQIEIGSDSMISWLIFVSMLCRRLFE